MFEISVTRTFSLPMPTRAVSLSVTVVCIKAPGACEEYMPVSMVGVPRRQPHPRQA